jgi:hypothetical protein
MKMAGTEARNFDNPDETRTPEKTRVEVVPSSRAVMHGSPGDDRVVCLEFESRSAEEYAKG